MIAHSKSEGIPEQSYEDHVYGVVDKSKRNLKTIKPYLNEKIFKDLEDIVIPAGIYHDLGKLCKHSQDTLNQVHNYKMPNHTDAGTAFLIMNKMPDAAWLVKSHHLGFDNHLSNLDDWRDKKRLRERCPHIEFYGSTQEYTDKILDNLTEIHNEHIDYKLIPIKINQNGSFYRLALSLLVDGDHSNTANNYKNFVVENEDEILLHAKKRLKKLNKYINNLQKKAKKTKRNELRQRVYEELRDCIIKDPFTYCSAEVGLGKTTALFAYALNRNPRRIIYVAPYTSIISQTVSINRNSLTLSGENKEKVVAANHHQVDFTDKYEEKVFATTWNSPIVATTAVQFVETLCSARTSKLRKYYNLAGSHIIIDESHACIPLHLWPILLKQLDFLVKNMGCSVTFASGSMIKMWENEEIRRISGFNHDVKPILSEELSELTLEQEKNRVKITYDAFKHNLISVCNHITSFDDSKLVVCNTIRNAAMIATRLKSLGAVVEHMSTCLTPEDREKILKRIKKRLKNKESFILVATSCVESGVDISFRNGFREVAGLNNILQFSGRVNREHEFDDSKVNIFELDIPEYPKENEFTSNPDLKVAISVFRSIWKKFKNNITPELCDIAINAEINRSILDLTTIVEDENNLELEKVHDKAKVISQEKVTVIPLKNFNKLKKLYEIGKLSYNDIVRKSFQFYIDKAEKNSNIVDCKEDGIFKNFKIWTGNYDPDFLGYMSPPNN